MPFDEWSSFDLVEGFHLTHAVMALRNFGVFNHLTQAASAADLATKTGTNASVLSVVLDYVATRTDLLEKDGENYVLGEQFTPQARFYLDQYIGAYGPNAANLETILKNPQVAGDYVDRDEHAAAWLAYGEPGQALLPNIIRQLELNHVLDMGCGPGSLLLDLARGNQDFTGWGVDVNPNMCEAANRRLADEGFGDRVRVLEGNCGDPADMFPADLKNQVQALAGMSLANEFFGQGNHQAIDWLTALRTAFPQRALLLADYYGRLGKNNGPGTRPLLLQDFVQILSGQGVPPARLADWKEIYEAAGVGLVHVVEDEAKTFFIHILRL